MRTRVGSALVRRGGPALLLLVGALGCRTTEDRRDGEFLRTRTVSFALGKPGSDAEEGRAIITAYEGLSAEADPSARDRHGFTPLFAATFGNDLGAIRALLRRGADPNESVAGAGLLRLRRQHGKAAQVWDVAGWTPLHLAAFLRRGASIEILLDAKAHVNAKEARGRSPLHVVFLNSYEEPGGLSWGEVLGRLIRRGSDMNAADQGGSRPLDYAAVSMPDAGRVLLQAGAKRTLRWASLEGNLEGVLAELAGHADVNARDDSGWTALHLAASEGHADIVRALLQGGARTDLPNAQGRLPFDVAKPDTETRRLLKSAGPKRESHRADDQ